MRQTEYVGNGSVAKLADIIGKASPQRVFLVTGKGSYVASGAAEPITKALLDTEVLHYTDLSPLPLYEDVLRGAAVCTAFAPDLVIVVGGGHVMDAAKAINFAAGKKPLVAIPTTAGTGSESTCFAVVYQEGRKRSLESPDMLPTFAIVDPDLAMSVPRDVAIPSALDALSQAIESFWSNKATEESHIYARLALEAIWSALAPALEERNPAAIASLCIGAHQAGKAINSSKTTACHAFSYDLTYRFGVPHGIAVAVFLPSMYRYNSALDTTKPIFEELNTILGFPDSEQTATALQTLLERFGVSTLSRFGVSRSDIGTLAAEVNVERLGNNPQRMTEADVARILTTVIV